MCGICGKLKFDRGAEVSAASIKAMADSIRHRGPDDEGFYVSGQVGLGFRRLSIIDLGGGHQPLSNEDGTVWIVFHGEIYNYQELRGWLITKGHSFKTQSDTEVIVHLYEELGEGSVERLRGMFAFAIWDARDRTLFLARDRVGIKPLYYLLSESSLIFGSEIKAILTDPEVKLEIVPGMIARLLSFSYLPGEETLLRNVRKLPPGSYLRVKDGKPEIRQYWDLHFETSTLSLPQAEERLAALLEETVRLHMISDVPVGFLLSGGVDSTAMLGLAHGKTDHSLRSFTIGFSDPGVIDERPYARLAAERYGTEHHEMTIGAAEFESFLPKYIWHMEEPICEPPAVAMYYISRLARESVKVLISGEGGDEAFAGYQTYRNLLWLERCKSLLKPFNRPLSAALIQLNRVLGSPTIGKYAPLLGLPIDSYYYSRLSSPFRFASQYADRLYTEEFLRGTNQDQTTEAVDRYLHNSATQDVVNKMLYVDTKSWLVDDLLLKADKITMANSIELRVPFLDHKVLEFAASLPGSYKVHGFTTKYIAKRVLNRQVPRAIIERKKVGFPVPYESWLRHELKDWLHDVLLDRKTLARGYFRKNCIEYLLAENLQHGRYAKEVFTLALLELWQREFLETRHDRPEVLSAASANLARNH